MAWLDFGRPRKNHVPDAKSVSAEKTLAAAWRRLSWRRGTKGALKARFAARGFLLSASTLLSRCIRFMRLTAPTMLPFGDSWDTGRR
ncbi:hypothetical protein CHELA40_11197 [Chelatococcus asaccharovorans]|nr:hypothetical protein CHELA40_11197 [Chelatococcus asaccharovorans]